MLDNFDDLEQNRDAYVEEENPTQKATKGQKLAIAALVFLTLCTFVLWFVQFRKNLSIGTISDSEMSDQEMLQALIEQEEMTKDTDGDSLLDVDELNIYKTSPYLEDSDSDGINDKQEIEAGTDPNCAAGKNCNSALENADAQDTNTSSVANTPDLNLKIATSTNSEAELKQILGGQNIDAKSLRQLLLSSGMSADILNKISDEQLLQTYQQTLTSKK